MFADDLKMYKAIRNIYGRYTLLSNLVKRFVCAKKNDYQPNVSKCLIMRFQRIVNTFINDYSINDIMLTTVTEDK